jgi:hypothetical protein
LLLAMTHYIVDIENVPSGMYAGRVISVHRSLPLAVAGCRVLADRAQRVGLMARAVTITMSPLEFTRGEFIPAEDVTTAYAADGTELT